MIKIVYGPKGSGKTKEMINEANKLVLNAKGQIVFVTDTKRYMYDLQRDIRFIDSADYIIAGEEALCGFIKGVVASNSDNEDLFIDGVARIAGKPLKDLPAFFYMIDKLSEDNKVTIWISCSCEKADLPDFVAKYI